MTHIPSPARSRLQAFTLIELLAVIGIIAVLLGLLLGAIGAARFRSRVAVCGNNFRQWGIAVNLYAHDDRGGRLPAFSIPLAKFKGYGDLHPNYVSLQMGTNLEAYGVTLPLWYCPSRPEYLAYDVSGFAQARPGRALRNVSDLTEKWVAETKFFFLMSHFWFVPRPLEGSMEVYPDPKHGNCRTQEGWPTRLEDPSAATQPILTDELIATWNTSKTALSFNRGHLFPRTPLILGNGYFSPELGSMRNINLLFVDGRVETRSRNKIQWQIQSAQGNGDFVVAY